MSKQNQPLFTEQFEEDGKNSKAPTRVVVPGVVANRWPKALFHRTEVRRNPGQKSLSDSFSSVSIGSSKQYKRCKLSWARQLIESEADCTRSSFLHTFRIETYLWQPHPHYRLVEQPSCRTLPLPFSSLASPYWPIPEGSCWQVFSHQARQRGEHLLDLDSFHSWDSNKDFSFSCCNSVRYLQRDQKVLVRSLGPDQKS